MIRAAFGLGLLLVMQACGPMPLVQAEQACVADAQLAQRPRGSVAFGMGSGGQTAATISLGISTDYLQHRNPDDVFAACVQRRAGQPPTRPFSAMPESRM
jgi:hypothetical protein